MGRPGARPPELALPVASLAAMRQALTEDVGADAAARALRAAGYAAGDALYAALTQPFGDSDGGEKVGELPAAAFWRRLSQLFSTRGWGTLSHEPAHQGVGALESANWVEAVPGNGSRPSCFFTTGLLANLLGRAAGSTIAVLEVECRSHGDERCRFMFGAPDSMNAAYNLIRSGETPDSLLNALV
jgi:predicted hydrocarbon binding protein